MNVNPPSAGEPSSGPPPYPPSGPPGYLATPGGLPAYPGAPAVGWAPAGPAPGLAYLGFWARFLGYVIDVVLLFLVEATVAVPLVYVPIVQYYQLHPLVSGQALATLPADLNGRLMVITSLGAVVSALYFGGLVAWTGRTLGQRVMGARVVRAEDGGVLPPGRSFLRAIIFWGPGVLSLVAYAGSLAGLLALIGLLAASWDPRKQGWHDKLGRSLVVKPVPRQY
ncbi:MAG: RDD family protein [Candidatus Dormibacteraeota bacterium]|nr:RDD family protein [Candidatus Dormibacteraeota bacterium]